MMDSGLPGILNFKSVIFLAYSKIFCYLQMIISTFYQQKGKVNSAYINYSIQAWEGK
jgi:hypothetical protein